MTNKLSQAAQLLNTMSEPEILAAVRAKQYEIIYALVQDGVKNRKVWTAAEVAELTDTPLRTVYNWINK